MGALDNLKRTAPVRQTKKQAIDAFLASRANNVPVERQEIDRICKLPIVLTTPARQREDFQRQNVKTKAYREGFR
jgi:hypothetical protein